MRFSILVWLSFAVNLLAAPAVAQPRAVTWDEIGQELAPGDRISLVQAGGESLTGELVSLGASELTVRTTTQPSPGQARRLDMTIPFDSIQSLERRRDSSRNGALLGAGIGAGFVGTMFVSALATDRNEIDEWGYIYLGYGALFTGIGTLVGWAIDNAHSKPAIRFERAGAETTRISVAPLGFQGRGVALVVSF
ncbi:MAG TPA: hypothetical protein VH702_03895 [Vicinamibacterales bacterium]|jgi:hypothetical protein